jgi:hypothetical protein
LKDIRGWDVVSTWTIRSISSIGLSGVALVCLPIAVVWMLIVRWIGREYRRRDDAMSASVPS